MITRTDQLRAVPYLTRAEAAEYAGVSEKTISRAVNSVGGPDELPVLPAKRLGRQLRIRPAAIDAWLDSLPDS